MGANIKITSSEDCSALHSMLCEAVIDFLEDDALVTLQNKLMNIINIRYGDSIEDNLRNDVKFRHLFENHSEHTADFTTYSSCNIQRPAKPFSPTNSKYEIVSKTAACDMKKSKIRNVSKDSKKKGNIKNANKDNSKCSHIKKIFPKKDLQKVIVEYSDQLVLVDKTNRGEPIDLSICTENSRKIYDLKTNTKNKDHHFVYSNLKKRFNLKESDLKENNSVTIHNTKKPEFGKDIHNTKTPKNVNCSMNNVQLKSMSRFSEGSTIPPYKNFIQYRLGKILKSEKASNIRKIKKPVHNLQKKFVVEASRIKNCDENFEKKSLPHQFIEHSFTLDKMHENVSKTTGLLSTEQEKKVKENVSVSLAKVNNDVSHKASCKSDMDNSTETNTSKNNINKNQLVIEFHEEQSNGKIISTCCPSDENKNIISNIQSHFMTKEESKVPTGENKKYKCISVNTKPAQEDKNIDLVVSHEEIIDNEYEIISLLEEREELNPKIDQELKNPFVTIGSRYNRKEDVCEQNSTISKLEEDGTSTFTLDINEDIKETQMNDGSTSTTDFDKVKEFKIYKEQNISTDQMKEDIGEKKDVQIIGKKETSRAENDVKAEEYIEAKAEEVVSIFINDVEMEAKNSLSDAKMNKEQEILTVTTDVKMEEKNSLSDTKVNKEQEILTVTTDVKMKEKNSLSDIKMNKEQEILTVITDVKMEGKNSLSDTKMNKEQEIFTVITDVPPKEKEEEKLSITVRVEVKKDIKVNKEQEIQIMSTDVNAEEKKYSKGIGIEVQDVDTKEVEHINVNEKQYVSSSTTDVDQGDTKPAHDVKINEDYVTSVYITDVNERQKLEVIEIKMNDVIIPTKSETDVIKYSEENLVEIIENLPEKANDGKTSVKNNVEGNELHKTSTYKNVIEYVKISSDEEENSIEVIGKDTNHTKEVKFAKNYGEHIIRSGMKVQNELNKVDLSYVKNNDTLHLKSNSGVNKLIEIYSEEIKEASSETSANFMNFGRNILLKVVYKKGNNQKTAVSVMNLDETKGSRKLSGRENKSQIKNVDSALNKMKKAKKRVPNEKENNDVTPKRQKYNLRSSSSEQKKKRNRRLFGKTEMLTRSHAINV